MINYNPDRARMEFIQEQVIDEMALIYSPPIQARDNPVAQKALVRTLVEAMYPYSHHVIREAWGKIKANRKSQSWPLSGEFTDACKHAASGDTSSSHVGTAASYTWDERKKRREALVIAYMEQFKYSALALEATAGGWWNELELAARQAADFQAQYITGEPNKGCALNIYLEAKYTVSDPEAEMKAFHAQCAEQAATGTITVNLPTWLVDGWRDKRRTAV